MNITYRAIHSFAQYLERNPDIIEGYLYVEKSADYVNLVYDTDDPDFSNMNRSRFAHARYRGEAGTLFLQLIEERGFKLGDAPDHNTAWMPHDVLEIMRVSLFAQCLAQQRINRLEALIGPDYGIDIANPEGQLSSPPSSQELHSCPHQLLRLTEQMVDYLNDDNSADLNNALEYVTQRYFQTQDPERAAVLAAVVNYPFDDAVELKEATEAHFRPFTLAGLWIGLPALPFAPIRVGIAMHDTRRPGCHRAARHGG